MRYFIGFLVTIGLIILVIVLLVGGGNNHPKVPTTSRPLASYATTDASVRLTIDGPTNSETEHQQIRITVDRNSVTYEQIQGYQGHVVELQTFPSNEQAYGAFLRSLGLAGYTQGDTSKDLQDERGYCALGDRYVFELFQDDRTLQRFWNTSCNKTKTYHGNTGQTVELFQAQVPDYNQLANDVNL